MPESVEIVHGINVAIAKRVILIKSWSGRGHDNVNRIAQSGRETDVNCLHQRLRHEYMRALIADAFQVYGGNSQVIFEV